MRPFGFQVIDLLYLSRPLDPISFPGRTGVSDGEALLFIMGEGDDPFSFFFLSSTQPNLSALPMRATRA